MENENKIQSLDSSTSANASAEFAPPAGGQVEMTNKDQGLQEYMQTKRKKRNRIIYGVIALFAIAVVGYFAYTNPQLFRAAIIEDTSYTPPSGAKLYIPSYTAEAGDTGTIAIKANGDFDVADAFSLIGFKLTYSPSDALIFGSNPLVFTDTVITSNALPPLPASPTPGELSVGVASLTNIQPMNGESIFKIETQINPDLPSGTVVTLGIQNFEITDDEFEEVVSITTIATGTITVEGQNKLKVLNAEAIDDTHILVRFSDLLSDIGETGDYTTVPNLTISEVVSGTSYGYDQKTVVLTADDQTAGTEYALNVDDSSSSTDPEIVANTQGGLQEGFQTALFYGYGDTAEAMSDFGIVSAVADGYNQITVTFTDDVISGSLSGNFTLKNINTDDDLTASISNVVLHSTDSKKAVVTLSASADLLKKYTYIVSADSDVKRVGDNASLGINKAVFNGINNGPKVYTATTSVNTVTINFDSNENIQIGTGDIATIYVIEPGSTIYEVNDTIDVNDTNFTPSVTGKALTLTNDIFNDPDAHFAFSVSDTTKITNTSGVPTDSAYNMITFWGAGHTASSTTGSVTVVNKNKIQIASGSLNFDDVDDDTHISVYYETGTPSSYQLEEKAIDSIAISAGNLQIVFDYNLHPDRHYFVKIVDDVDVTLLTKRFVLDAGLNVNSAQADSATQITVQFSENIDASTLSVDDFTITPALAISSVDVNDYQNVKLTTLAPMSPATVYTVKALDTTDPIYSADGSVFGKNSAVFTSHETAAELSDVYVSDATSVANNKVRLTFSGAVNETTLTPVNINLKYDPFTPADKLTIQSDPAITKISGNTYELTTNVQQNKNYFVVMNGVKDASGLLLGNNKVPNFFGFQLPAPSVSGVVPSSIVNDEDRNVMLSGQNLGSDIVQSAKVGNQNVTITSQSANSLTITIPSGFTTGVYSIKLTDIQSGTKTFSNLLSVNPPSVPLQVISSESKSIPVNVPNDGTTPITLWVKVYDPVGIDDINTVVVDLSQIGGISSQQMTKDTATQPQYVQWYKYGVTVPATVATSLTPYLLPVEVHKGLEVVTGTISVVVTGDIYQSVAPTVDQAYINPVSVPPDGTTPISISAQVTDLDGVDTISSVVADLGSLGIGFIPLSAIDAGTGGELTTGFYQSATFTVPSTTAVGTYSVNITASDNTGGSGVKTINLIVSTQLTGPKIDAVKSYVAPTRSITRGSAIPFSLHVYVTDPDGIDDVTNVTASFGVLGLPPATLLKDPTTSSASKSAFFAVEGLTIPTTAPFGVHSIEITAEDSTGGLANHIIQIDVTYKDMIGDPPIIIEDKGYTTPKVAINDGETPIILYAFIRDDDDDIESVVINLSQIGQVGPETAPDFTQTTGDSVSPAGGGGTCPTGSNVLVCMNPSVKEGVNGQWFILPGVTVSKSTMPSSEAYMLNIVATDITGKSTQGVLSVYINDGESFTNDMLPPKVVTAVPTSATTIEVVFSEEIMATSVSSGGSEFKITDKNDITKELDIVGATINAAGTIVTLSTENQSAGKQYVLSATSGIKDSVGVSLVPGAANRVFFEGFQIKGKVPIIDYITATYVDSIEIEFRDPVKPTSLKLSPVTGAQAPTGGDYNVEIFEADSSVKLPVTGVSFGNFGNVLIVKTANQKSNQRYRVQIKGVESYDGKKSDVGASQTFKGYNLRAVQHQAAVNLADFDGNGVVDFSDFTIFSSVYGTVYYNAGGNETDPSATGGAGQPITPVPDATVPITTTPAGGDIIE